MTELRNARVNNPDGHDLLTMLANSDSTRDMSPRQFLGTLLLLIIGGNDTTRNSISAGVLATNRWPEQFEALKGDRSKIPNAVAEIQVSNWGSYRARMLRALLRSPSRHDFSARRMSEA